MSLWSVFRTTFCITALKDRRCNRGDDCIFAHSYRDLIKVPCELGAECKYINKIFDEVYENVEEKNICRFWHTNESPQSYFTRMYVVTGIVDSIDEKIWLKPDYKPNKPVRTVICNSITRGKKCLYGKNCNFAHSVDSIEEKNICQYGKYCSKIFYDQHKNVYGNVIAKNRVCSFWHPNESKENYATRIFKPEGVLTHNKPVLPKILPSFEGIQQPGIYDEEDEMSEGVADCFKEAKEGNEQPEPGQPGYIVLP
jgi:hypothetical protein